MKRSDLKRRLMMVWRGVGELNTGERVRYDKTVSVIWGSRVRRRRWWLQRCRCSHHPSHPSSLHHLVRRRRRRHHHLLRRLSLQRHIPQSFNFQFQNIDLWKRREWASDWFPNGAWKATGCLNCIAQQSQRSYDKMTSGPLTFCL